MPQRDKLFQEASPSYRRPYDKVAWQTIVGDLGGQGLQPVAHRLQVAWPMMKSAIREVKR